MLSTGQIYLIEYRHVTTHINQVVPLVIVYLRRGYSYSLGRYCYYFKLLSFRDYLPELDIVLHKDTIIRSAEEYITVIMELDKSDLLLYINWYTTHNYEEYFKV